MTRLNSQATPGSGSGITELTGDVTAGPGSGSQAATIANDAVTNAKAANMAQSTIKGRAAAAGTGDPTDLTATQATAILDAMVGDSGSGGTKGLAPAPASGDAAAGKFLKADGTWVAPTGSTPGSGALVFLAEFLLGSDSTTVSFTSIPGTYRHLRLVCCGRLTGSVTNAVIGIQFNGDTGSNYDGERAAFFGAGSAFVAGFAQTSGGVADFPGANASSADQAGQVEIVIANYSGTTFNKNVTATSGAVWNTSGNNADVEIFSVMWRNTAAITQIDLLALSGNFKTGSLFSLYGMT